MPAFCAERATMSVFLSELFHCLALKFGLSLGGRCGLNARAYLKACPRLEDLEERCVLDFAPDSFLKTPFLSHAVPLAEHFHPHLHIFIDGVEHVIPGNTNIVQPTASIVSQGVAPGLYSIHTHIQDLQFSPPDTSKLHVESTLPYDFHLGDFFTIWTYTSGSAKILNSHEIRMVDSNGQDIDFTADATHTITMTVNSRPNSAFDAYVLSDPHAGGDDLGPNIVITGTTVRQPAPPPTPIRIKSSEPNQMLVSQYYRDCLGRSPDPEGMSHFSGLLDQGNASPAQVALTIQTSLESRTRQVETLYHKFLGREADPIGLDLSTRFLGMGGSFLMLESVICGSPEYFRNSGGGNSDFLAAIYRDALGRTVDSVGQSIGGQALSTGMDHIKVAEVVFTSPEGTQDFVKGLYIELLHRPADEIGLTEADTALRQNLQQLGNLPNGGAGHRPAVKQGATEDDVISTIMASNEYIVGP